MAINAAKLVAMQDDIELAEVVRGDLVTADGQAVVRASRVLGDPLPTRVAGIDLMEGLLSRAATRGYILGAQQDVLERAIDRLHVRYAALQVVGYRNGYFEPLEEEGVAADIRQSRPDISPRRHELAPQELFLGHCGPGRDVPFVMGVGGAIDVVAGMTRRAPRLEQRAGLGVAVPPAPRASATGAALRGNECSLHRTGWTRGSPSPRTVAQRWPSMTGITRCAFAAPSSPTS